MPSPIQYPVMGLEVLCFWVVCACVHTYVHPVGGILRLACYQLLHVVLRANFAFLLLRLSVEEFWKNGKIWRSICREFWWLPFFRTEHVIYYCWLVKLLCTSWTYVCFFIWYKIVAFVYICAYCYNMLMLLTCRHWREVSRHCLILTQS